MTDYDSGFEDGESENQQQWELALKDVLPAFLLPDDEEEEADPVEVAKYIKGLREALEALSKFMDDMSEYELSKVEKRLGVG